MTKTIRPAMGAVAPPPDSPPAGDPPPDAGPPGAGGPAPAPETVDDGPAGAGPDGPAIADPPARADLPTRLAARQRRLDLLRERQRRHRAAALTALLAAAAMVGLSLITGERATSITDPRAGASAAGAHGSASPGGSGATGGPSVSAAPVPSSGTGDFDYAKGTGKILGSDGSVRKFRVAVEDGTGVEAADFARTVEKILGDPRGWTAGGDLRFQRVPEDADADFTISLATAETTDELCGKGGLHTGGFLSCALPEKVVINLTRWLTGVPDYGAPLENYRQYAINHEIGRELGGANETCPGTGMPAPVMQQQSLDLAGCRPNAWPFLNGEAYDGPVLP